VDLLRRLFCKIAGNVLPLSDVANFVTDDFPLKINNLAKRKREFTAKLAILLNGCCAIAFFIN
jgi:hypothetical protein